MGLLDDPKQYENMSWKDLYMLRLQNRGNPQMQGFLAPYEHRAYAREQVAENPLTAPVWAVMPAGYQINKLLGGGGNDDMSTPASWDQMFEGMKGVGDGLKLWWQR